MLSATVEDWSKIPFPVFVSPKLDGIRAMVIDGVLVSRNLKPIPNAHCQALFGHDYFNGLDGELIVGKATGNDVWNRSQSGVMKKTGKPDVKFHVFDCFYPTVINETYQRRQIEMSQILRSSPPAPIEIVPQYKATCESALRTGEDALVREGYEGAMLRKMRGPTPYKFGRSTLREGYLMKLVRRHTIEGRVVGMTEQLHNGNEATKDALGRTKRSSAKAGKTGKGTLGTLVLRPVDQRALSVDFEVGTGMTDAERARMWRLGKKLNGALVTVEYRELTPDGVPRFASFKGIRHAIDA